MRSSQTSKKTKCFLESDKSHKFVNQQEAIVGAYVQMQTVCAS